MKKDILKVLLILLVAIIPTIFIINKTNVSYSKGISIEDTLLEKTNRLMSVDHDFSYSLDEVYSNIENDIINEDLKDIYINFYNYFDKDIIFKNKYKEEYTYESYSIIKSTINDDELFVNYIINYNKCNLYLELFNTNQYCR